MNFYTETLVITPRREHCCYLCHKPITGRHWSIAQVTDGDFYHRREHIECHSELTALCAQCEYKHDCELDMRECFNDARDEQKRKARAEG